jgi:gliding motility-associated-like protein
MRTWHRILLLAFSQQFAFFAQNPICPSPYVYLDNGNFIRFYDPGQPMGANNPANTNIPTFGSGLTLMPNINGGTLSPTFYSTSGGNYYYWSGTSWVNTGHSTGNTSAVNLGGCPGRVYNLVGGSGQVYAYDGTGNGYLLTTIQGFNGGGPYDIVTDCNCNFYVINTNTTGVGQSLTKFNNLGVPTQSWSLVNMPSASAGGGFAIVCDKIFLRNSVFYVGDIVGSSITFTAVSGSQTSAGDYASCPICTTSGTINASVTGAMLTCASPSANLVVTTTATPVSYSWSGPGIIGSTTNSVAAVNAQGVYTCVITGGGCPVVTHTVYSTVISNTSVVTAVLSPSGNICSPVAAPVMLNVTHSSSLEVVNWSGPGLNNPPNADNITVPGPGSYTVTVTNPVNGCSDSDVVNIVQTPTVSVAVSSNSICAFPFNGSPANLTITPMGAPAYTLIPSSHYTISNPSATIHPVTVLNTGTATAVVIGRNAFCADTAFTSFVILQNPVVSVPTASICPGLSHLFIAGGADTYTWTDPQAGASTGSNLAVSPAATTAYTVVGSSAGCQSSNKITTLTILPIPTLSVSPVTSTICLGSTVGLNAIGTANNFSWTPAMWISNPNAGGVVVYPMFTNVYNVLGALNGCTNVASATVNVVNPPVLVMNMSSSAMCYTNYHGSPTSLTIMPSGALSYSMLAGNNFNVINPTGPSIILTPAGPPSPGIQVATATLVGVTGVCTVVKTQTFHINPNPDILISPQNASICPGQNQLFTASGASSYTWYPAPHMFTISPTSMVASPPATNFYPVRGTSLGCHSDTKYAVLVVLPKPEVTVSPVSATLCAGDVIKLVAGGNGSAYTWTPAAGLLQVSGATVTASPVGLQSYTVVSTLNTCTNQAIATVSAIAIPKLNITATHTVVCSGAPTSLKATGAESYSWTPPESINIPAGTAVWASPMVPTEYTVRGFNGICTSMSSIFIQTVPRPDLSAGAIGGVNTICSGSVVTMTVTGAQQYHWQPSQFVQPLGSYSKVLLHPIVNTNFTVVGTNSQGSVACSQLITYSVLVVPKITPVIPGDTSLCEGDAITLAAYGGNMTRWSPPDGLNATEGTRVVASPSVSTIYTAEVSHSGYCAVTTTLLVDVFKRPKVFAGRDTVWHINDAITLTASGTGSLYWVSGDGIACNDCAVTRVHPLKSGCYTALAINEYGCEAKDNVCLGITEDFYIYIPNSFTPNNDGLNDVFYVYGENIQHLTLEIFDRWGLHLFTSNSMSQGWDGSFRGTQCKPDAYTYRVSYTGLDRKRYQRTGHVNLIE